MDISRIKLVDCIFDFVKVVVRTLLSKRRIEEWLDFLAVGVLKGSLHILNLSMSCVIVKSVH